MSRPIIAILATGDEIIHGDTLNTNGHEIARALSAEGLALGLQLACGDQELEIKESIGFLAERHNIIIILGGLGPTSDDRTRFALQQFLHLELHEFPAAISHIEHRLRFYNQPLNQGNRQQALFPADAILLPNAYGTAMGAYLLTNNKLFILLPGPPRECLPMFENYILPILQKLQHSDQKIYKWQLFGIAESQIAHKLDESLAKLSCKTAYRLDVPYLEFKVICVPDLFPKIKQIIEPLIAPFLLGPIDKKASRQLCEQVIKLQSKISICDQATGGFLQTLIQTPATYKFIDFNPLKQLNTTWHFHIWGLEKYWNQEAFGGKTTLHIKYTNAAQNGTEMHELQYYSALVVPAAAEWISFRLLKIIY